MGGRSRNSDYGETTIGTTTQWYVDPPVVSYEENRNRVLTSCTDTVGYFAEANMFDLDRRENCQGTFDAELWSGDTKLRSAAGCPVMPFVSSPDPLIRYPLSQNDRDTYAWDILAATNPSVPHVSVPTAIGELKDLPDLIKDWGGGLLRKIAKGHLSWRWAVRPMIRDIQQMCKFQKAVDDRIKVLLRLRDDGFIGKRCKLGSEKETGDPTLAFCRSAWPWIFADRLLSYSSKVWGSCRWYIDPGFVLPGTADGLSDLAWRLTFGITSYEALATLWELLPWSWFVDWFISIGDMISAGNNSIPCTPSHLCLMRTLKSSYRYEIRYDLGQGSQLTYAEAPWQDRTVKLREVLVPPLFPSVSFPFLDWGKWSILGSIAVLRR